MKIDLHVHSKEFSPCGRSTLTEQVEAAIAAGLDALVFADHDHLLPLDHLTRLNDQYAPFRVFSGIEISLPADEHLLALGVHDARLEMYIRDYPTLRQFVHDQGGIIVLNHPFRYHPEILVDHRTYPPDAIEAYSNNIVPQLRPQILAEAVDLKLPVVSNSDGHHTSFLGRYYNELPRVPQDEQELITLLKTGQFTPVWPSAARTDKVFTGN